MVKLHDINKNMIYIIRLCIAGFGDLKPKTPVDPGSNPGGAINQFGENQWNR